MKNQRASKSVVLASFLLVTFSSVAFAVDGPVAKVGTVDMQQAIQSVEAGKSARSQLEKDFNAKKKEPQAEEANLKKLTDEFKKQSLVLSGEALAKKQGEIQEKIYKFQEHTARSQQEIANKERSLTEPILEKLKANLATLAKKNSYTQVIDRSQNAVPYFDEKLDLTKELIDAFNAQHKSGKSAGSTRN